MNGSTKRKKKNKIFERKEKKMKVKELKETLKEALRVLKDYKPSQEVDMKSNTYFLQGARVFLGIAGYDGGYIDLDSPVSEDED